MKHRIKSLGMLVVAIAAAPPLAAQQTGSILPDPTARPSERDISAADRARQTVNDYGMCIVKTKLVAVRKALAQPDEAVSGALARLAGNDCLMRGELRMSPMLMRGAVYRALYIRAFGRSAPQPPKTDVVSTSTDPLRVFGQCVNRLDPANVRALVLAVPATSTEAAALQALTPIFSRCVAPGQNIRFSRAVVQSALAESAYRDAVTASGTAG
jgi:hypothetical protein